MKIDSAKARLVAIWLVTAAAAAGTAIGICKIRELKAEQRGLEEASRIRAELREAKEEFARYGKTANGAAPCLAALGYLIATALENSDIEGDCIAKAKKGDL